MEKEELQRRINLLLDEKVELSKERIKEWYEFHEGKVYISFSGGKDSTVLLDIVRSIYPEVPAVFINTGLEYPEVLKFVHNTENVIILRPKMKFKDVIEKYGFPVISKENSQKIAEIRNTKSFKLRQKRLFGDDKGNGKLSEKWIPLLDAPFKISHNCCNVLKKNPVKKFEKETGLKPYVGTMVSDSRLRKTNYLRHGCNNFTSKRGMSLPLSFWTEDNIWEYIKTRNILYSKIYDMGYSNTGCIFCMFGVHLDKTGKNKFQTMKETHPKHYDYCINKLGCGEVMDYIGVNYV